MATIATAGVFISLLPKSVAICVPECPGLFYSLNIAETYTGIIKTHNGTVTALQVYPNTATALEHFKAEVIRAEMRRRHEEKMAAMQVTFELAIATPLGDDADDGLV